MVDYLSQLYLDLEREMRTNAHCAMCSRAFYQSPEDPPFCSKKCMWNWAVRYQTVHGIPRYWEHEVFAK